MYRFNGFTQKANHAMNLAIQCAEEMGHTYVGSEHILLGLLKEGSGVAAAVLRAVEVDASQLELLMTQKIGLGIRGALGTEDFTPRTKRILQIAVMQAARMASPMWEQSICFWRSWEKATATRSVFWRRWGSGLLRSWKK